MDTANAKAATAPTMGPLESWVRRLFGGNFDVHGTTYEQVVNALRGTYDLIDKSALDAQGKRLSEQIETALGETGMRRQGDGRAAWRDARLIEQRMVGLLSGATLWTELQRRVDEADRMGLPEAAFYRTQLTENDLLKYAPQADATKQQQLDALARALLLRVVTDLQGAYTNRYVKTRYSTRAVRRASWVFGLSFLAFMLVLIAFTFEAPGSKETDAGTGQQQTETDTSNPSDGGRE